MRGRVLLSDDEESHNVHTGRMATARATDTSVGRPQRAVAIRAAELARRNRNLAASILGQLPREANSDSWRRPAVVIDFNLASSSDSDSSAGRYFTFACHDHLQLMCHCGHLSPTRSNVFVVLTTLLTIAV
uniref:Uncharacterized protein n=1 Tax=Parascaris equorum TaxID=6256 RepID=A0A914RK49_PAREQ